MHGIHRCEINIVQEVGKQEAQDADQLQQRNNEHEMRSKEGWDRVGIEGLHGGHSEGTKHTSGEIDATIDVVSFGSPS